MTRTLDPVVYWKLRAFCAETQRCVTLVQQAQELLVSANKKQVALLTELGFDPNAPNFTLNDDTLAVTFPEKDGSAPVGAPF